MNAQEAVHTGRGSVLVTNTFDALVSEENLDVEGSIDVSTENQRVVRGDVKLDTPVSINRNGMSPEFRNMSVSDGVVELEVCVERLDYPDVLLVIEMPAE